MSRVTLLGPQRHRPTIAAAVHSLGIQGTIATITAGWEERELEDDELEQHLGGRARNLQLWERCERAFEVDPELFAGFRARTDRLRALRRVYRQRLSYAMDAVRDLLHSSGDETILAEERDDALRAVRRLDEHHIARVREVVLEFEERFRPAERDSLIYHRSVVARRIRETEAVCIAGGHVAVLMNRMSLFDVPSLIGDRPVLAWSAGAMALGDVVVLFHDDPPQGRGYSEVLVPGFGLYQGVLPFPHANHRLNLDDPRRARMLSRRFPELRCVPMDEGDRLDWSDGHWTWATGTRSIQPDGSVVTATS